MDEEILWYHLPEKEVISRLNTNPKKGLSEDDAAKRLQQYGRNALPEGKIAPWFFILLNQFKSPLIYILLIAAAVSYALGEVVDMWVILAAVFVNTIVGYFQEHKAEQTIAHLKKIVSFKAKVFRDGKEMSINSTDLVPGDILLLEAGDRVPADGRILELNNLQINEASLTGESMPASKEVGQLDKGRSLGDRTNMVLMGTTVSRGRARVIVTQTGVNTSIGEIAKLVTETTEGATPLQLKIEKFSKKLGFGVLIITIFIFVLGISLGNEVFEMFETAIAIAVAAIPEGLIVAVTIILTIGMQRILKKKALVRKLVAAETLGSTSVICTDKTGTLTEGNMRVAYALVGKCDLEKDSLDITTGKEPSKTISDHVYLLRLGIICNNTIISEKKEGLEEEFIGDHTEIALLRAGIDSGLDYVKIRKEKERLAEIPFSTEIKYMATLNTHETGKHIIYTKGAPEKILGFATHVRIEGKEKKLDKKLRETILQNIEKLTTDGLRVLGAGYKLVDTDKDDLGEDDMKGIVFLGVFALKDPLRLDAKETITLAKRAGIRPIIITGDHKLTVTAIAKEIGIEVRPENVIEGYELDELSDDELEQRVKDITVYARVSPKHKLRIVDAWQAHGEVVAMIGDGVNDAPALKTADIGVALGSGTDVAKGTADIILLDDQFRTIVAAVRQGRIIFDNIRKIVVYLLSDSFSEIILIGGALLIGFPLPLTALQILYINFIADGLPNIALSFEPGEKDIMKQKPRAKKENILNRSMLELIFLVGIITDIILFGLYLYLLNDKIPIDEVRTIVFVALGMDSLLYVFSVKSLRHPLWHINPFSNKYLLGAVGVGFGLILIALYIPIVQNALSLTSLDTFDWLVVAALGMTELIAIELGKYLFIYHRAKRKGEL